MDRPDLDIRKLETKVLESGIDVKVEGGRNWKVMGHGEVIGAKAGIETQYSRVEITPSGEYHGSPITAAEYKKLTKK
ncbi:hypothetical protein [Flavobacterium sp.]|uniref:hypothetical protein n=1 Tax=Flavobacterium sp. TaxID=239 RepID=UPI002637CCB7|nr:hypothetical protein [Flavobacterium sp.]